ncbi:MAG TPA: MIP/aquaporin family protein [Polaromonas sp.]|uniref:MIP/aquaporin family protein n=1 Tax=Polaromonas sp. TaxID=1869339 RepID=UPI002D496EDD|nr:MIP/aquaporin family protein [Polaromonas sp.]HYW58818.1 MIP/aquaporin family protein [Polaromonas sp.]
MSNSNSHIPAWRAPFAEFLGTAALLCAVIGSGIMADRLSAGNAGVALLANTFATVFALYVLIEVLGPVSGAHFNPVVTLTLWSKSHLTQEGRAQTAMFFIASQLLGAVAGAWLAHAMFDLNLLQVSSKLRDGAGQWLAEGVATAGLILVVLRSPPGKASALVACYIGAAYWFTASTSFANPAAVLGRMLSDSFAGIAPSSAPGFVLAQVAGATLGVVLDRCLGKDKNPA